MPVTRAGKTGVRGAAKSAKAGGLKPSAEAVAAILADVQQPVKPEPSVPEEPQARPVVPFGVRGVDFVEIWHAPEGPDEQIRLEQDRFIRFRDGLLVVKDAGINEIVKSAARKGHYVASDADVYRPFVCQICQRPWYSQEAFSRHTVFKHASGMVRK